MTWGIPTSLFLQLHVALSLAGIATGFVSVLAMVRGRHLPRWTAAFLTTTFLTGVTGFPLAPFGLDPPRIVGIILLCAVIAAGAALYLFSRNYAARNVYVVGSVLSLYLNVFVAVAQAFQKVGPLRVLAPTGSEPPFLVAQVCVLGAFLWIGYLAIRSFRPPVFAVPSAV